METIFDTRNMDPKHRFRAWQEMIRDVYVNLDVMADDTSACEGRVRAASFGAVKVTETTGFPQRFVRRKSHLATLDKDCFYMQFLKRGAMHIVQRNSTVVSHPGAGCLISASDPYDAVYRTDAQALYLEIPREPFLARFPADALPAPNTILRTGSGMGRVAAEFCDVLVKESAVLPESTRRNLGEQIMDILALALDGCQIDGAETSIQSARLRSIKAFIDENLADPGLSLAVIGKRTGVSLSYLHRLFKDSGGSVSEWIWLRRLQRCYEMITQPELARTSITDIAYSMGFSSSSHFSNLFRETFGLRPSDLRRSAVAKPARDTRRRA
jgi:AraC-like DNA-binding protein